MHLEAPAVTPPGPPHPVFGYGYTRPPLVTIEHDAPTVIYVRGPAGLVQPEIDACERYLEAVNGLLIATHVEVGLSENGTPDELLTVFELLMGHAATKLLMTCATRVACLLSERELISYVTMYAGADLVLIPYPGGATHGVR